MRTRATAALNSSAILPSEEGGPSFYKPSFFFLGERGRQDGGMDGWMDGWTAACVRVA